jgi:hypothetical protein
VSTRHDVDADANDAHDAHDAFHYIMLGSEKPFFSSSTWPVGWQNHTKDRTNSHKDKLELGNSFHVFPITS